MLRFFPLTLPLRATLFVLVAMARPAAAIELLVTAEDQPPVPYQVSASPAGDSPQPAIAAAPLPVESSGLAGKSLDLPLDAKLAWRIEVKAAGFWSPPSLLPAGAAAGKLEVRLLKTSRFEFRADPLPAAPQVDFSAPAKPGKTKAAGEIHRVGCQPAKEPPRWTCEIPRGTWDLRLAVEGRVPRYFWQARLDGASHDVGKVVFLEGASLAGYVVTPDRQAKDCKVEAFAVTAASASPAGEGRAQLSRFESTTDDRGFFQIAGLPPGSIRVEASRPGLSPGSAGPLTIVEGREKLLEAPLEIGLPSLLAVALEPPMDPYGQPWRIDLIERFADAAIENPFARGQTSPDGRWSTDKARSGSWRILIADSRDNRWSSREFSWQPGDDALFVEVERLPVQGSVRLGDEAVSGAVVFGTSFGSSSLRFELDEKGRYSGFLPSGGQWKVELLDPADDDLSRVFGPFEVEKRPGKSYAEVDIKLPDTHLAGKVIQDGEPVAGAQLTVLRYPENRRRDAFTTSRPGGRFELNGLEPGNLVVQAKKSDAVSEWISVSLAEGAETEIELVLEKNRHLQGQVIWRGGEVPGATVVALFKARGRRGAVRTVAGFEGAFDLALPASANEATLLVLSPAFDIGIQTFRLADQNPPAMIELAQTGSRLVLHGASQEPDAELRIDQTGILIRQLWQQVPDRLEETNDSLAIQGLSPGLYQVCAGENGRPPCSAVQLPAGGMADIHLKAEESP